MLHRFRTRFSAGCFFARVAAGVLCCVIALGLVSCKHAGPDATTPKKVAVAFARAAEAGDGTTLHQLANGTDAEFAMVKDLGLWMQAVKRFKAAAADKFGEEGKSFKGMPLDVAADFESADEKIDGNTATLTPKSDPATPDTTPEPMKFTKDGDSWKLDLKFLDKDETAAKSSRQLADRAHTLDAISKDLEERNFRTLFDLKVALRTRLYGEAPAGDAPVTP